MRSKSEKLERDIRALGCWASLIAWHETAPHLDVVLVRCNKSGNKDTDRYPSGQSAIEFVVWTHNRECGGLGHGHYHLVDKYGNEALALVAALKLFFKKANLAKLSDYA